MYLLSESHKSLKNDIQGKFISKMLYLEPNKILCPNSGDCMHLCLKQIGRMKFKNSRNARLERTKLFFQDRELFLMKLHVEIKELSRLAIKKGKKPLVRLNGTSDIDWTQFDIINNNPEVFFYDYTKNPDLFSDFLNGKLPNNYHLIYSFNEKTKINWIRSFIIQGGQIAVVFKQIPETWKGFPVINGDKNDLRMFDKPSVIIGLRAKGPARKSNSQFVQ
tara:strand:+ start:2268 stop:2927 length:660 start_codon:yes stop_codon:yes gene_type:complete